MPKKKHTSLSSRESPEKSGDRREDGRQRMRLPEATENNRMDLKERRRTSREADVAGSPRKRSRGNISHSADPCNNVQVDVSVRKRDDDGGMPGKRRRYSDLIDPADCSDVGDVKSQRGKRKASVDAGPEKTRCAISTPQSCEMKKRKASDDREAPRKKMRCASTSSTESRKYVSADHSLNNSTLTGEEKIYAMASSGNTNRADFEDKYQELDWIGAGGFGSVYGGFRKADFLPVAIKHIPNKNVRWEQVSYNGKVYNVILEVAFMLKTAGLPGSVGQSAVVSLLDWYILDQELIMVMEKPNFCKDLSKYCKEHRGSLDEREAKMILRQLVDAAITMHSKGVFHRDIKLQNVLIHSKLGIPRVRVIDFGCGSFCTEELYYSFCGTVAYAPPEWFESAQYSAGPTTVWQLGALFYSLLNGNEHFTTTAFIQNHIKINHALSTEVKTLLHMCLARYPEERGTLEELQVALREPRPPKGRSDELDPLPAVCPAGYGLEI